MNPQPGRSTANVHRPLKPNSAIAAPTAVSHLRKSSTFMYATSPNSNPAELSPQQVAASPAVPGERPGIKRQYPTSVPSPVGLTPRQMEVPKNWKHGYSQPHSSNSNRPQGSGARQGTMGGGTTTNAAPSFNKSIGSKRTQKSKTKKMNSKLSPDLEAVYKNNKKNRVNETMQNMDGPAMLAPVELDDNDIQSLNLNDESCIDEDNDQMDLAEHMDQSDPTRIIDINTTGEGPNYQPGKTFEQQYSSLQKKSSRRTPQQFNFLNEQNINQSRIYLQDEIISNPRQKDRSDYNSQQTSIYTQARASYNQLIWKAKMDPLKDVIVEQDSDRAKIIRGSFSSFTNTGQMRSQIQLQTQLGSNKKSVFKKLSGIDGSLYGFQDTPQGTTETGLLKECVPIYISSHVKTGKNLGPYPIEERETSQGSLYKSYNKFITNKPVDLSKSIQNSRQNYQDMQNRNGRRMINVHGAQRQTIQPNSTINSASKPFKFTFQGANQPGEARSNTHGQFNQMMFSPTMESARTMQNLDLNLRPQTLSTIGTDNHPSISKNYPKTMLQRLQQRMKEEKRRTNCLTQRNSDRRDQLLPPPPPEMHEYAGSKTSAFHDLNLNSDTLSNHTEPEKGERKPSTFADECDLKELSKKYRDSLEAQYQTQVENLYQVLKQNYEQKYGIKFKKEDEMVKFIIGMAQDFDKPDTHLQNQERKTTALSILTDQRHYPSEMAMTLTNRSQPQTIRLNHRGILDGQAETAKQLLLNGLLDRPLQHYNTQQQSHYSAASLPTYYQTTQDPDRLQTRAIRNRRNMAGHATDVQNLNLDGMTHRQLSRHLLSERAKLDQESKNYESRNKLKKHGFTTQRCSAISPKNKLLQNRDKLTEYEIFSENNKDKQVDLKQTPRSKINQANQDEVKIDLLASEPNTESKPVSKGEVIAKQSPIHIEEAQDPKLELPASEDNADSKKDVENDQNMSNTFVLKEGDTQDCHTIIQSARIFSGSFDQDTVDTKSVVQSKQPAPLSKQEFQYSKEALARYEEKKWLKARLGSKSSKSLEGTDDFYSKGRLRKILPQQVMQASTSNAYIGDNRIDDDALDQAISKRCNSQDCSLNVRQDKRNIKIVQFCTLLFHIWLADYEFSAQKIKEANLWHASYQHKECVAKNLQDKCLPVDYFIERMMQLGLCRNLRQVRELLLIMESFDSPGLQTIQDPAEPEQQNTYFETNFMNKELVKSDGFKLLNSGNVNVERHLRLNLDRNQFKKFDRISINQFLSLFNVHGVKQGKLLDRYYDTVVSMAAPPPQRRRPQPSTRGRNSQQLRKDQASLVDRPLSADHRRLIGLTVSMLSKKYTLGKLEEGEFLISGVGVDCANSRNKPGSPSNTCLGLYERVRKVFGEIISSKEYLRKLDSAKKMRERRLSREAAREDGPPKETVWNSCRLGQSIYSKDVVVDIIENVAKAMDEEQQDCQPNKPKKSPDQLSHQVFLKLFQDLLKEQERRQVAQTIMPWLMKGQRNVIEKQLRQRMSDVLEQEMRLTNEELKIRKQYREELKLRMLQVYYNDQFKQRCSEAHDRMDIIGKQMLLDQICIDVIVITQIIRGVIKADRPMSTFVKDNEFNQQNYQKNKQTYKLLFRQYVMKHIRKKYANQAFFYVHSDHQQSLSLETQTEFEAQGVKARGILLEICGLLMKQGKTLKYDVAQDWYPILSSNEQVCKLVNYLTNMLQNQINQRAQLNRVPNENFEELVQAGKKIWSTIDQNNTQFIPRRLFDDFLLEKKIISDSREVTSFMRGVLNGRVVQSTDTLKNSHYLSIMYKAILRQAVLNILNHMMAGQDVEYTTLNGMVQRLQRKILYAGIRTKNTKDWQKELAKQSERDKLVFGGPESYSQSCVEIIEGLQRLKDDPRVNKDKCQIKINQYRDWLVNNRTQLHTQNAVLIDFKNLSSEPQSIQSRRSSASSGGTTTTKPIKSLTNFQKVFPPHRQDAIKSLIIQEQVKEDEGPHQSEAQRDPRRATPKVCTACNLTGQPARGKSSKFISHICKSQLSKKHYRVLELRKRAKELKLHGGARAGDHALPTHSFLPTDDYKYDLDRGRLSLLERQNETTETTRALANMARRIHQNKIGVQKPKKATGSNTDDVLQQITEIQN